MEEFELEPGEQITLMVRKHWFVLVFPLIGFAIFALLPLLVLPILAFFSTVQPATAAAMQANLAQIRPYAQFILAFYWLILWMLAYAHYLMYYLTIWIITTTRIVEVHQYGFFSRRASSFLLNRVQDVTIDTEGFLQTMFSYGSLDVETAGRTEQFNMTDIVNPQKIRDLIMREVDALSKGMPASQQTP